MAEIEIRLPKMGESVTEATITNWLKVPGDKIALDEALVEVATDKVDNELPSEVAGTLLKCFFEKDQVAQVGDVIAIISTDGPSENVVISKTETAVVPTSESPQVSNTPQIEKTPEETSIATSSVQAPLGEKKFYSPLVKSIAQKENISRDQLDQIIGTGPHAQINCGSYGDVKACFTTCYFIR